MAGLKIEGKTYASDEQLAFIKDVINKRGFKDAKVVFETVGQPGDNYSATVMRVIIQGNDGKSLIMIAKLAPTIEAVRMMTDSTVAFKNEHIMYTQVLPKFEQLQKAADIPDEDRLKFPLCYGSFEKAPNEVILLEDLKVSGFEMVDKIKPLSNHYVKSILKNFALLHSLSYVLKHKEPEVFDDFRNSLVDGMEGLEDRPEMKSFLGQLEASSLSVLESDIHKKVVKEVMSVTLTTSSKMMRADRDSKYAIIHHGDAWTNNFMFRFKNRVLEESIMIDYQGSKSGNAVVDHHHMIFNCTDYESRNKYFNEWIDYYHSELDKHLSCYGLKANYVYPRDKLDADLKRYSKISLRLSIIVANMLLIKPEDAGKMKEAMDSADMAAVTQIANSDRLEDDSKTQLKLRLEGIINSFIELGYVKA